MGHADTVICWGYLPWFLRSFIAIIITSSMHVFPLMGQKSCRSKMFIIFTYHCNLWLSRRLDRKNVNAMTIAKSTLRKLRGVKLKMHFRYYYSVPISCFLKMIRKMVKAISLQSEEKKSVMNLENICMHLIAWRTKPTCCWLIEMLCSQKQGKVIKNQ